MSIERVCSNHVGYNGDRWGVRVCNAQAAKDCSHCHKPACAKHLDNGEARQKCMDCYEAENAAYRAAQAAKRTGRKKARQAKPARTRSTKQNARSPIGRHIRAA
jgi:hypothetical protein